MVKLWAKGIWTFDPCIVAGCVKARCMTLRDSLDVRRVGFKGVYGSIGVEKGLRVEV